MWTKITDVEQGMTNPYGHNDIWELEQDRFLYTVAYDTDIEDDYPFALTLCEDDAALGARAVAYSDINANYTTGRLNVEHESMMFACLSGVLGKAATFGYAPEDLPLEEFNLVTDMLRADYCQEGQPNTVAGRKISILDRHGINWFGPAAVTKTEAVWRSGVGAVCVNYIRKDDSAVSQITCEDGRVIHNCSEDAQLENEWNLGYGQYWTKIEQ